MTGILDLISALTTHIGAYATGWGYNGNDGKKWNNGGQTAYGESVQQGEVLQIAVDLDVGKIWWGVDNVWQASGDPVAGTGEAFNNVVGPVLPAASPYQTTNEITIAADGTWCTYSPPSGFSYWDDSSGIIIQTPEIIIALSNSADIQIGIGSPEATIVVIQSSGDLFVGVGIETPEIVVALSNSSDIQISVAQPEAQIVIGASSDIQIQLSSPEAIINSSHSIGEIFTGVLIQTPEIGIASNAATYIGLFLASPEIIVTSGHDSDLAILLASPEMIIEASIAIVDPEDPAAVTFTTERAYICYLFSLTKVPGIPDIEIPISSFQSRLRNGDPSYLSVVIPGLNYSGAISVRADADMVVEMAYKRGGAYIQREEIARVTLENVIIYQGASKQSIVLSGHRTETYSAKGFRTRQSPFYYTLSADAKARYRFPKADFGLNPGDTFTVGSDVFTVGLITHIIGGGAQQMEVAEA
jgi:hypothetical protein